MNIHKCTRNRIIFFYLGGPLLSLFPINSASKRGASITDSDISRIFGWADQAEEREWGDIGLGSEKVRGIQIDRIVCLVLNSTLPWHYRSSLEISAS